MNPLIAGVDEVGRGCLAGRVFAAAVMLPENFAWLSELKDSKVLTPSKRELLDQWIKKQAIAWSLGWAEVLEIEKMNILQATLLAMERAVAKLSVAPDKIQVDGNQAPQWNYPTQTIVGGDRISPCIMAASIVAKVARDQEMVRLSAEYPQYGFEKHKGYGTKEHMRAIQEHGICPLHRRTFRPIVDFGVLQK